MTEPLYPGHIFDSVEVMTFRGVSTYHLFSEVIHTCDPDPFLSFEHFKLKTTISCPRCDSKYIMYKMYEDCAEGWAWYCHECYLVWRRLHQNQL